MAARERRRRWRLPHQRVAEAQASLEEAGRKQGAARGALAEQEQKLAQESAVRSAVADLAISNHLGELVAEIVRGDYG